MAPPTFAHTLAPLTSPRREASPAPGIATTWVSRIAVRALDRIVIVPTASITRIDAEGNYVRLWTERSWLHKDTLTSLCSRLDPTEFLRVHRSHAINLRAVAELVPRQHGEFRIRLRDGAELVSGRLYKHDVRRAFGLA